MPQMSPHDIAKAVELYAKQAIDWSDQQSGERKTAMEYYDGIMNDTPSDPHRSSVVSRDFRAITKKVLPAITRTIFGSEKVVEYAGVGDGDDTAASQATDYVNLVVLPECHGEERIRDAIHDALRIRNGIMKWWWDETIDVRVSQHSGLTLDDLSQLAADDEITILEQFQDEQGLYSIKLRRKVTRGKVEIAAIPLEEFFISPDALMIDEAVFCAHNQKLRRSQLVAMGYDREIIDKLPAYSARANQDDEKTKRRGEDVDIRNAERIRGMDEIDYWECFVRLDADDDGIAELRRVVMAGGWSDTNILENDEIDEAPFTDIVIERRPHEWQGRSLFDDTHEIQRVKTVLLRNTLDNIYWQNNLQPIVSEAMVSNMDAVLNPQFGKPILVKGGGNVNDSVTFAQVPFVAKQAFDMLAYMDEALADRTGINDSSGGLPPDALQNVTAKASALMEQQGISQVELMVRNVAVGLKRLFRGVLKLVIQHQDKPRMMRLNGQPVQFDPRTWNADMDATVNVGLGAGTRERDMMAMQIVMGMHKELLAAFGPADNPFVTPDQLYNAIAKTMQAAGLKSTQPYLSKPTPESIEATKQRAAQQKSPEQEKAEAALQLEQVKSQTAIQIEQGKAQVQMELEQKRMEVDASKEREQRDADLIVKSKELENDLMKSSREAELRASLELELQDRKNNHELEKLAYEHLFERERMQHAEKMAAHKMANDNLNADADRSASVETKVN